MNLSTLYSDKHIITDCDKFLADRKTNLGMIEWLGLEHILQAFITEYEWHEYGSEHPMNIHDVTRYLSDCVDILDGYENTYLFDRYAIKDIWMTNGGAIILSAFELPEDCDSYWDCVYENDLYDYPIVHFRLD